MTRAWIVDALGEQGFEQLATRIPGSELQSLLLEVMRARAQARTPAEVLELVIDPSERATTVHGGPPERAKLPIWLLVVVLVLGAAGAFALVRVLTR